MNCQEKEDDFIQHLEPEDFDESLSKLALKKVPLCMEDIQK